MLAFISQLVFISQLEFFLFIIFYFSFVILNLGPFHLAMSKSSYFMADYRSVTISLQAWRGPLLSVVSGYQEVLPQKPPSFSDLTGDPLVMTTSRTQCGESLNSRDSQIRCQP